MTENNYLPRNVNKIMAQFDADVERMRPEHFINEEHQRRYERLALDARKAALSVALMYCSMPLPQTFTA